jgi:hypothetical protein
MRSAVQAGPVVAHLSFGKPTSGILVNTVRASANDCPLDVRTFLGSLLKYSNGALEEVDGMDGHTRFLYWNFFDPELSAVLVGDKHFALSH